MPAYFPVLIDPANHGLGPASGIDNPGPQGFGPFVYRNNLYIVLIYGNTNTGPGTTQVFKSVNQGSTWTGLSIVGAPSSNTMPYFDGNHTILCATNDPEGTIWPNVPTAMSLINFDLSTETWGPNYGTVGAPLTEAMYGVFQRTNGDIIVLHNSRAYGDNTTGTGAFLSVFSGGAWVTTLDMGANLTGLPGFDSSVDAQWMSAVIDSSGIMHIAFGVFGRNAPVPVWNGRLFYQQLLQDNTLGQFFDFPGQSAFPQNNLTAKISSQLVIYNGNLILPEIRNTSAVAPFIDQYSIWIGTGLVNPVWSELASPGIFPAQYSALDATVNPGTSPSWPAYLTVSAGVLYAVGIFNAEGNANNRVYLAQTSNPNPALGWGSPAAQLLFDYATSTPATGITTFFRPSIKGVNQYLLVSAEATTPTITDARYWLGIWAPPVNTPNTPGGGPGALGAPFVVSACKKRNDWDWCLFSEELDMRKITFPPMCNIPEEYRNLLPWDDTFGAIPPQAVQLHQTKGMLTPAPAAGDQVVLSIKINSGFDGLLSGVFQFYTGTGFVPGSGDIIWRIQVNQRYLKGFANNLFSLGNPQLPIPLTEGHILLSGQTIRYIVNVPNLSGQIQVGQSQIVCGLLGFFWPRG